MCVRVQRFPCPRILGQALFIPQKNTHGFWKCRFCMLSVFIECGDSNGSQGIEFSDFLILEPGGTTWAQLSGKKGLEGSRLGGPLGVSCQVYTGRISSWRDHLGSVSRAYRRWHLSCICCLYRLLQEDRMRRSGCHFKL